MQQVNQIQAQPTVELLLLQAIQLLQSQQQAAAMAVQQQSAESEQGPETLDVKEAAEYLRVSDWTIYDMVRKNQLIHFRVRSRIFFRRRELDKWISSQLKEVR